MKRGSFAVLMMAVVCLLAGCQNSKSASVEASQQEAENLSNNKYVYYLNKDETKIVGEEYQPASQDTDQAIREYLNLLRTDPMDTSLKRTLGIDVELEDYSLDTKQLVLNFTTDYANLGKLKEILFRAAVVRTMNQIKGVDCVVFQVAGQPLTDSTGSPFGGMTADMFIDNAGNEINAYERTNLTLYFANEDGTKLVEEKEEDVVYSSNISMEKLVLEKLLEGPVDSSLRPTLSPDRKISSVTVKNGVCYVNFAADNIDFNGAVSEEVSVYSIVNSLSELKNVNKVQISIDGDTDRCFRENISLDKVYERNLDIMEKTE